jgi:hypothetical protein
MDGAEAEVPRKMTSNKGATRAAVSLAGKIIVPGICSGALARRRVVGPEAFHSVERDLEG